MYKYRLCLVLGIGMIFFTKIGKCQEIEPWKTQLNDANIEVRLNALYYLSEAYNQISLDTALLYAYQSLQLAQQLENDSLLIKSFFRLSVSYHYQSEVDSVIYYAQKGMQLGEDIGMDRALAYGYKLLATAYRDKSDYIQAREHYLKGSGIYELQRDTYNMASIYGFLVNMYRRAGDYEEALKYAFQEERLIEGKDYEDLKGVLASSFANIYLDIDKNTEAIKYLHKALASIESEKKPYAYAHILIQMAVAYEGNDQLDSAILCNKKALEYFERLGDISMTVTCNNNIAHILLEGRKLKEARRYLHEAREEMQKVEVPDLNAHVHNNYGRLFESLNHMDSAEWHYLKGIEITKENKLTYIRKDQFRSIYLFYKKKQDYNKALDYYERYIDYIDKTEGIEIEDKIAYLEAKYEAEKKQRQIESLHSQALTQRAKANSLRIGILSLFLISIIMVMGLSYKRKNEQKLFAFKRKMLEEEKNKMDMEIEYKSKQLSAHALHMAQKSSLLQEIQMRLEQIETDSVGANKKVVTALIRRINFSSQSDSDWEKFRLYFEQTNQSFYKKLAEVNNNLTTTELKLSALIKLNMNIKEIAAVLNIAPASVKTSRHRLKKKLGLKKEEDLNGFIRMLS